jgi:oligoendopeptidase F
MNKHITPIHRAYLPSDFHLTDWETLEPYLKELVERPLTDKEALSKWLLDWSELEAVISEQACWKQIRLTCDTQNNALEADFQNFILNIEPKMKPYWHQIHEKLLESPLLASLDQSDMFPFLRHLKGTLEIYKEANIPLQAEINVLAQQYGSLASAMTIDVNGEQLTLQQASKHLQSSNATWRFEIFSKIAQRRLDAQAELNSLFNKLLKLRNEVASNAGFKNFRDYQFKAYGRYDYTPEDCFNFHQSIKKYFVPLHAKLQQIKKQTLGVATLKPWDLDATPAGETPLEPFKNGDELVEKSIALFYKLDPFFANCIQTMKDMKRLDLDSRIGKAPGGYNCPLAETGVPFIFMNAAGTINDLITMMHESGHAFHSFLSHELRLNGFKEYPMEMAELASMSMELFTFSEWGTFFDNERDLAKAQFEELDRVVSVIPWIAIIDQFQHWIYENPCHSDDDRTNKWLSILADYDTGEVDWDSMEAYKAITWQKQLHLFEVPFYYIEYGIAQLGAIAVWRNYMTNPEQTLQQYKAALALGYTKTLPELYATAGIQFDFKDAYVKELAQFMEAQIDKAFAKLIN